jgi:hypothetical protein
MKIVQVLLISTLKNFSHSIWFSNYLPLHTSDFHKVTITCFYIHPTGDSRPQHHSTTSQQSVNSRKRAPTEPGVEERNTKKLRVDGATTMGNVNGVKDKKKNKRKKKNRTSVILLWSNAGCDWARGRWRLSALPQPLLYSGPLRMQNPLLPLLPEHRIVRFWLKKRKRNQCSACVPYPLARPDLELTSYHNSQSSDKGKGKAKSDSPSPSHPPQPVAAPIAGPSSLTMPDSSAQASEVARPKAQLAEQTTVRSY